MTSPPHFFIPWIRVVSLIEMRYHATRFDKILDFSLFYAWGTPQSSTKGNPQMSFQEDEDSDDSEDEHG